MAIHTEETTVGGLTFSCTTLPATRGFALAMKLPKYFAGALGGLTGDAQDPAQALRDLGERLASEEALTLVYALLEGTAVQGVDGVAGIKPLVANGRPTPAFDLAFAANYGALLELIVFAFRLNFGRFFADSPALASLVKLGAAGSERPHPSSSSPKSPSSSPVAAPR